MKTICSAAIAMAFCAAYATAITTDTTVTLTADSTENYEVAENVTLTFEVASGTRTHSGTISGLGKVKKDGAGALIISGNNTFEGGFEQAAGTVQADSATAFGTGDVTCSVPATGKQLIFNVANAVFVNNFKMTAKGTAGSSNTPFMEFRTPTTINGNVTFYTESWASDYAAGNVVTLNGSLGKTGGGSCSIIWNNLGDSHFKGPLKLSKLHPGNFDSQKGTNHLWSTANSFTDSIIFQNGSVLCHAENVISGAKLMFRGAASTSVAVLDMGGWNQTIKCFTVYNKASSYPTVSTTGMKVYSADPATLTLTGTGAGTTATNYFALSGKVSLLLNAAATFKQIFTRRASDTTGSIEARKGILEMTAEASFKNASTITVADGMSFLMNSTAELALENVGKLVLNGTFTVGESSSQPFGYGTLDLELGPNAQLTLPAGSTLTVKSLKVDGNDVTGVVNAGQYGLVSGTIFVRGEESSDVWTGAGASLSIALADNWQSQETPNLGGGLTPTFAAADAQGFTANVDRDVVFDVINFSSASGFTFAGTGTMAVKGGIAATPPATGDMPVYEFHSPLWLFGAQTMDFPTNATQRLLGGSKFSYDVVRQGQGDFAIAGSNVWDNKVIVRDCDVYIAGTITTSTGIDSRALDVDSAKVDKENAIYMHMSMADYNAVTVRSTKDSICTISNAVIEKPFQIRTASVSSIDKFRCAPGTTNYFKSYFLSANASNNGLKIPPDSEVHFEGGGAFLWSFYLNSGGTAYFRNKPIKTLNSAFGLSLISDTTAVFEVGGNTIKGMNNEGGTFDFRADDVVGAAGTMLVGKNNAVLHLNSTFQTMGAFSNKTVYANSYIDGNGATLFITNNVENRGSWIRIPFNGDVSLRVNTPSQVWLDSAASTSTGSITVERGTLEFRSGASWTNVSEVVVAGGRLDIKATSGVTSRPVFGRDADMLLSGDGVVALPNGAAVWVKHLYVNGVQQPKGTYRYDTIQDAAVKAHFDPESTGTLVVRGDSGFSFTIR